MPLSVKLRRIVGYNRGGGVRLAREIPLGNHILPPHPNPIIVELIGAGEFDIGRTRLYTMSLPH